MSEETCVPTITKNNVGVLFRFKIFPRFSFIFVINIVNSYFTCLFFFTFIFTQRLDRIKDGKRGEYGRC